MRTEPKVKEASVCLPRSLFSHFLETNEETTVDMQGRTLKLEKGGLLERKSDPTLQRKSDLTRPFLLRRALITGYCSSMRYIKRMLAR